MLALVSQVFVFVSLEHLLYLSRFILVAPITYQLFTAALLIIFIGLVVALPKLAKRSSVSFALVALNLGLLIYAVETYTIEPELKSVRLIQHRVVGSSAVHSWSTRTGHFFQSHSEGGNEVFATNNRLATEPWWQQQDKLPEQLLLVLNESWGVPTNPLIQQEVLLPIAELVSDGYIAKLTDGQLPFTGATVDSELKALCRLAVHNFNLRNLEAGFENCLPNQLAAQGYFTQSLHAAAGVLYDRIHWYPMAGFQKSKFFEHYTWQRRCFSYPGGCDFEAIDFVAEAFAEHPKLFFYWLTLNTHAIYDRRDIVIDDFDCEAFAINPRTQSCRNLILQKQFFTVLANKIRTGAFSGAEILIVSDHDPVITNLAEKEENFEIAQIPWIRFKVL